MRQSLMEQYLVPISSSDEIGMDYYWWILLRIIIRLTVIRWNQMLHGTLQYVTGRLLLRSFLMQDL